MKIRSLVLVAAIGSVLMAVPSHAQIMGQNLKVFVGYSNLQGEGLLNRNTPGGLFDADFFRDRTTLHGFEAAITGAFRGVGVTGDFSFNRNNQDDDAGNTMNTDVYYLMAGPSFHYNGSTRLEPFGRILAGGARTNFDLSTNLPGSTASSSFEAGSTSFAMAVGGGFDWRLGDGPYRVRLVQVDYSPVFLRDSTLKMLQDAGGVGSTLDGQRQDNVRFSFGFVF